MAMVVKNNMSAVRTLNTLNTNSSALQKSLAKVSSGMKINSAQDDASGYAISERMRVQIRSLDQANQNTQNASSLMKTAEGAVGSTMEILKTLKEKAINAATDTNTDQDRQTIQKELDQYIDQIDDNALTTFNGKYLVDGSKSQQGVAVATAMTNQSLKVGTTGTTALVNLYNRNNESLEIAATDYVTASFVKDGKTYTTKFGVKDNTLEDIFNALDAQVGSGGNKVFANTTGQITSGSTTGGTTPADPAVGVAGFTENELKEIVARTTSFDKTDAKQQALYKAFTQKSDGTDATAGTDDKLTSNVATAKSNLTDALKSDLDSNTDIATKVSSAGATVSSDGVATIYTTTSGDTNASVAGKVADKVETDVSAAITAGTSASDAVSNVTDGLKVTFGGTNYAAGATNTTAAVKDAYANAALEKAAAVALFGASANNQNATDMADELANTPAQTATTILSENTNLIGTNTAGDNVYTADETEGLTVRAVTPGIQGQVSGLTISITDSEGNVKKSANAALDAFKTTIYAKNESANNEMSFQVGAGANQAIAVGLDDMRSEALGLKGADGSKVSVATQDKANAAVAVFDNAIQKVLDQQATIGAIESRLEYTSQNLTTSSENVQAAESTIRDADMAKEMTTYTKNNVLLQAAQSMLAQANQNSSAVLSLLQ